MLGGLIVDFGEKTIDLTISSRVNKLNNLLQGPFLFIHVVPISCFASDRIRLKDCNLGLVHRLDQNTLHFFPLLFVKACLSRDLGDLSREAFQWLVNSFTAAFIFLVQFLPRYLNRDPVHVCTS